MSTFTPHGILSCFLLKDRQGAQQLEGLKAQPLRKADFLLTPPHRASARDRESEQERLGREVPRESYEETDFQTHSVTQQGKGNPKRDATSHLCEGRGVS